jgi:hypothetical protein
MRLNTDSVCAKERKKRKNFSFQPSAFGLRLWGLPKKLFLIKFGDRRIRPSIGKIGIQN